MKVILSDGTLANPPVECDTDGDDIGFETVVVCDQHDNPIFFAIQKDENTIYAVGAEDPNFEKLIKELPLMRRVRVPGRVQGVAHVNR